MKFFRFKKVIEIDQKKRYKRKNYKNGKNRTVLRLKYLYFNNLVATRCICKKKVGRYRDTLFIFIHLIFRYTKKRVVFARITNFYFIGKIGAISICTMYTTCHNPDTLFRSDGVRFRLSNLDTVLPFHTALRLKVNV